MRQEFLDLKVISTIDSSIDLIYASFYNLPYLMRQLSV